MKTPQDPRHLKRIQVIRELFAWDFQHKTKPKTELALEIIRNLPEIDQEITQAAPEWPLKQINRIDLSILRLVIFELIIKKGVPFKVVADEAVELAKEFGGESSPEFVNGVLGHMISAHGLEKEKDD